MIEENNVAANETDSCLQSQGYYMEIHKTQ